jgi:hypothetical protein
MKKMIVITCRNSNINYITNCVKSIRDSGNKEIICIVDSGSPDKSYFKEIEPYNVIIEDINNQNYVDGAIWYCYEKYTDIEFFYFIHDSMIINKNLTPISNNDLTVFSYFEGLPFDSEAQLIYSLDKINSVSLDISDVILNSLAGLFGTSFYCKRKILDELKRLGLNKILPTNKLEACASERIWAIFLYKLGIDIRINNLRTFINQNTEFDNKTNYITKIFAGRS